MTKEEERTEMVRRFFEDVVKDYRPRWCTADRCACMGCVNGGFHYRYSRLWKEKYGDEPYLTQKDVEQYKKQTNQ